MCEVKNDTEILNEIVWCYCCEEFTPHEVYDDSEGDIYVCECGCELIQGEDEIIWKDLEQEEYKKDEHNTNI